MSQTRNYPANLKHAVIEGSRPIIAITMGDAAGIGPEIIVRALSRPSVYEQCRPIVIGDAARLRRACQIVGQEPQIVPIKTIEQAAYTHGAIDCLDLGLIPESQPFGQVSSLCGDAAYQYVRCAAQLAMRNQVDAICTAPLNKEALHAGGHRYPGHTELLAELTNTPEVSMMLSTSKLNVIHVTTHIGLLDAIERIEPGLVERTIVRMHEALNSSGIPRPRIGVCGINPHAGENGLFGRGEEELKINPAIAQAQQKGIDVSGPLPADTLFFRAARGDFDGIVAMYHDQGHGPVKVMGLEEGVNVTIGLPVIRTSVDHGTAFDIAGQGVADERSLLEALSRAIVLAPKRS